MSFEYDPHNKLRHTSYWFEADERAEWPLSDNAKEEEAPRENEPFDYSAIAKRFYFEVETVGSVSPQEVVLKVRVHSDRNSFVYQSRTYYACRDFVSCKRNSPISFSQFNRLRICRASRVLTFQLKWACNPQPQRGVDPLLQAQTIHILAQVVAEVGVVVGKLARGVEAATNGVGEDREPAPVRTRAGTRQVPVGILVVVHGVVRPHGTFESCKL